MSGGPQPHSDTLSRGLRPAGDERKSILLVDDSVPFRERLAQAFTERGFQVRSAGNYDEAMVLARQQSPDMAVVDLRMPGRPGLDLVADLTALDSSIEVLVLTGFGSIATTVDALRRGAVNYLPKPADADDILSAFARGKANPREVTAEDPETPSLARAEWEHIHRVLADCDGNISEAARRLGIHRRSLQRKLQKRAPE